MVGISCSSTPAYRPSMIFIDYDAIVDHKDPKYDEQNRYFERIQENNDYEVKLGRLIKTKDDRYRQKGVDILLAVDMITKAFLNHYDIALFLGGDDDYVDLVKSITEGFYRKANCRSIFPGTCIEKIS